MFKLLVILFPIKLFSRIEIFKRGNSLNETGKAYSSIADTLIDKLQVVNFGALGIVVLLISHFNNNLLFPIYV